MPCPYNLWFRPDLDFVTSRKCLRGVEKPFQKPQVSAVTCNALSGFVRRLQSYDYIPSFVAFFDIPVCFGHLFQRIAFIHDRF